jgi:hypothetical protein
MARCRECNANVSRYAEYCGHCGVRSPAKGVLLTGTPRRRGGFFLKLACGLLVIGLLAAVLAHKSTLDNATATDNATTTATAAKQKSPINDIAANKDFLAENPKYLDAVRTLISTNGFDCPQVTHLFLSDPRSPYGIKLEALCGPSGNTNAYPALLRYTVYPDRLKVVLCKLPEDELDRLFATTPFGILGGSCD